MLSICGEPLHWKTSDSAPWNIFPILENVSFFELISIIELNFLRNYSPDFFHQSPNRKDS